MKAVICKNEKAFTLTELLIVLTIIGILALIVSPNLSKTIHRNRVVHMTNEMAAMLSYTRGVAIKHGKTSVLCAYDKVNQKCVPTAANALAGSPSMNNNGNITNKYQIAAGIYPLGEVDSLNPTKPINKPLRIMEVPSGVTMAIRLHMTSWTSTAGSNQKPEVTANYILFNKNGSRMAIASSKKQHYFNDKGAYKGDYQDVDSSGFFPVNICIRPTNSKYIEAGSNKGIQVGDMGEATLRQECP